LFRFSTFLQQPFSIRLLLNLKQAGAIIGERGLIIQNIKESTSCDIVIGAFIRGFAHRVAIIQGTLPSVESALNCVAEALVENDLSQVAVLVADAQIPGLIGRAGSVISRIRTSSGASIQAATPPPFHLRMMHMRGCRR
jgi:transcription antitermination factor NusA-like protein